MLRPESDGSQRALPPARILAVDDTPANLVALEALLEPLGYEFVAARSGPEALALAESTEVAVILLDIQMPDMDGFETLERLREGRAADTPVIFLTASAQDRAAAQRAYALGAFDFIMKPIESVSLRGKVRAFVAFHDRGRELRQKEQALQTKDRYLGMLAHDLRTPLSVIRFAGHLLSQDERPETRSMAARIERSTTRMEHLTRDLLEYARAAAQRMPITRQRMDLVALCRELIEDMEATHPDVKFSAELALAASGTWDRDRLHQAIANLLSNAVKYGDGRVALRLSLEQTRVVVAVSNFGEPLDKERIQELYQPFVRGRHGNAGVGLGLFIVREIALAHGGEISSCSDLDGTCFTLRLPLA